MNKTIDLLDDLIKENDEFLKRFNVDNKNNLHIKSNDSINTSILNSFDSITNKVNHKIHSIMA